MPEQNDLAAKVREMITQVKNQIPGIFSKYKASELFKLNEVLNHTETQLLSLIEQELTENGNTTTESANDDGLDPNDAYYAMLPDNVDEVAQLQQQLAEKDQRIAELEQQLTVRKD